MMTDLSKQKFLLSFFLATVNWYVSAFIAFFLNLFHTSSTFNPSIWYSLYAPSFYDGFQQHLFYLLFIILGPLLGFSIKYISIYRPSMKKTKQIYMGTSLAILLIPLSAIGIFGISLVPNWPAMAPPIKFYGGTFWLLPGCALLIYMGHELFINVSDR